jgi:hypothetical protein
MLELTWGVKVWSMLPNYMQGKWRADWECTVWVLYLTNYMQHMHVHIGRAGVQMVHAIRSLLSNKMQHMHMYTGQAGERIWNIVWGPYPTIVYAEHSRAHWAGLRGDTEYPGVYI